MRLSKSPWEYMLLTLGTTSVVTILCLVLCPPIFLIWLSLGSGEAGSVTSGLGLKWYHVAVTDERTRNIILYSFYIAMVSAIAATVLAFLAAMIFVRRIYLIGLYLLLGIPVFVPGLEHGLALSNTARYLGVGGSDLLLILADTAFVLPYSSVVLFISLARFPHLILDIARELGASDAYAVKRILLPEAKAGLVGSVSVAFFMALNEHSRAFYLASDDLFSRFVYGKMLGGSDPSVYAIGSMLYVVVIGIVIMALMAQAGVTHRAGKAMRKHVAPRLGLQ
jgi:spermidine/putrescine transport system permease protein